MWIALLVCKNPFSKEVFLFEKGGAVMAKKTRIKSIRKSLLNKEILLSSHAYKRMHERGYSEHDIIQCILNGKIISTNRGYDKVLREYTLCFVLEGKDFSGNPMVCVISQRCEGYRVVTVMPPTDNQKFSICI